jgi:uncharacterized spore protein YtfJ
MDPHQVLAGAQDALAARRVFGEPIQSGNVTVIPAAHVRGGGGGGGDSAGSGGVGFGINARPAGVFVIRNDDVRWRPAVDVNRVILGGQLVAMTALITLRPIIVQWLSRQLTGASAVTVQR